MRTHRVRVQVPKEVADRCVHRDSRRLGTAMAREISAVPVKPPPCRQVSKSWHAP
jgi:hypothetical protein